MHLHEAMGNALEILYGERVAELSVELAYNFESAGLVSKAVWYLQQAGDRATRLSDNAEANRYYQHAIDLLNSRRELLT